MSDERIPDDIKQAARTLCDFLGVEAKDEAVSFIALTIHMQRNDAILAERNRVHKQLKGKGE